MSDVRVSAVETAVRNSDIDDSAKTAIISDIRSQATIPDTWIYRIVVIALGLAIFVPLVGMMGEDGDGALKVGQLLLPIATGALGALAGLLAPSPARN